MQTLLSNCSVRKLQKGNPQSYSYWTKNGYAVCGPVIPNDFSAYIPMQKELTPL